RADDGRPGLRDRLLPALEQLDPRLGLLGRRAFHVAPGHAWTITPRARSCGPYASAMTTPRDPEELEAAASAVDAEIPPATTLGPVHLTVSDLERSLAWYERALGLRVLAQEDGRASLGGDSELLALVEEPGAPHSHGHTG